MKLQNLNLESSYPNHKFFTARGTGTTSPRTRASLVNHLQQQGIENKRVLEAIALTPRHFFLDSANQNFAYKDLSLPIGYKQTISKPFTVAKMLELLVNVFEDNSKSSAFDINISNKYFENQIPKKVLEIGAGSGYQASLLGLMFQEVISLERIANLHIQAKRRLQELALINVEVLFADGHLGYSDAAPYDVIISAAAPKQVPKSLLQQLAVGGVLLIPLGDDNRQDLYRFEKVSEHKIMKKKIEEAFFVPMLHINQY